VQLTLKKYRTLLEQIRSRSATLNVSVYFTDSYFRGRKETMRTSTNLSYSTYQRLAY